MLDTDVLSALRRGERAPKVADWLRRRPEASLFLSVVTLGEIERGIRGQERANPAFAGELRLWVHRTVAVFGERILPFGPEEARLWGRLSHDIGHGGADLMIAATAMVRGATVVTGNIEHFRPTGVALENPF